MKVTAFTVKAGYEISYTKLNNAIICKFMKRVESSKSHVHFISFTLIMLVRSSASATFLI